MSYNVIIPCSGPGSRSSSYSKFHKALIRIGKKAVINHIIDSYRDAKTIFIMLGYNGHYITEYLTHCGYKNIQYINIPNWQESQFESLRQLPSEVFNEPFYLNSCDNWTTTIPSAVDNTAFLCKPANTEYYDKANGDVFAGIGYVKDGIDFYNTLHSTTETRNDYLIYKSLLGLQHCFLDDWYDVGNIDSLTVTQQNYVDQYDLLDKTSQEIYYVNDTVIKLFNEPIDHLKKALTTNLAFPHPDNLQFIDRSISYDFVKGKTNVDNEDFSKLFKNLCNLWNFCITNNKTSISSDIWQHKTIERFEQFIKKYPEFSKTVKINGNSVDPVRVIEQVNWKLLNQGIYGPCHGDLNLDNIILDTNTIYYIDHRASVVQDIFYDVCKLYHSLYLDNKTLKQFSLKIQDSEYEISIDQHNPNRRELFINSELYNNYRKKIELGVGCIWLSMSPLNVDDNLNKFLFLYAITHLQKISKFEE
jgi:hypothetical protein